MIIVDDNPLRLFQFRNVRVFKKFHADDFCGAKSSVFKQAVEGGMLAVEAEIKWALDKMKAKEGRTFAEAYLPFTSLGQITVQWLMSSQKWMRNKRGSRRRQPLFGRPLPNSAK